MNNKCKNCYGPSEYECLSCEEDKYFYNNECIDKYSDVSDNSVEEKKITNLEKEDTKEKDNNHEKEENSYAKEITYYY